MFHDLATGIDPVMHYAPAVRTATPTLASADLRAHKSAAVLVHVGEGGITFNTTNRLDVVAEHSDDGSTWTACVTGDFVTAAGVPVSLTNGRLESYTSAKAAASTNFYGYTAGKPYLRVTPTFGGTHSTGTMTQVTVLRGDAVRALAT